MLIISLFLILLTNSAYFPVKIFLLFTRFFGIILLNKQFFWKNNFGFGRSIFGLFTKVQKLVCAVWTSHKEIIQYIRNFNDTFIVGSINYWLSTLQDHSISQTHQRAVREEHNKALKEEISVPLHKVVHNVPADSAISMGLQNIDEKEKQTVEKLHEIVFYLALKRHPFTNFQDQIKLENLHGVTYTGAYENESACKDFIFCIFKYFLRKMWKKANNC